MAFFIRILIIQSHTIIYKWMALKNIYCQSFINVCTFVEFNNWATIFPNQIIHYDAFTNSNVFNEIWKKV